MAFSNCYQLGSKLLCSKLVVLQSCFDNHVRSDWTAKQFSQVVLVVSDLARRIEAQALALPPTNGGTNNPG